MKIDEAGKRRRGRVEPETPQWWRSYNTLKSEGFVHDEASLIAEGIISSPAMMKGRRARKKWFESIRRLGLSDKEIEKRVDEMYDTEDWMDPYTQFYPETE